MTDRDRLIELLKVCLNDENIEVDDGYVGFDVCYENIADYLLANGVGVLPLPIGSTVYEIRARGKRPALRGMRKCDYSIYSKLTFDNAIEKELELYVQAKKFVKYDKTRWNKTVFLTKEEAEAKLKELKDNVDL